MVCYVEPSVVYIIGIPIYYYKGTRPDLSIVYHMLDDLEMAHKVLQVAKVYNVDPINLALILSKQEDLSRCQQMMMEVSKIDWNK